MKYYITLFLLLLSVLLTLGMLFLSGYGHHYKLWFAYPAGFACAGFCIATAVFFGLFSKAIK